MSEGRSTRVWRIECSTEGREVYLVEAETEQDARDLFYDELVGEPVVSEVLSASISDVFEEKP